jgi:hypothetical protein
MPSQCLDIAKDVHQTDTKKKPNLLKDLQKLGACNPAYMKCIGKMQNIIDLGGSPSMYSR